MGHVGRSIFQQLSQDAGLRGARLNRSIWQLNPVRVVLLSLVLFRKNLFEPMCLLLRGPFVSHGWFVPYYELFAASIASQRSHLMKPYGLPREYLTYLYRLRFHLEKTPNRDAQAHLLRIAFFHCSLRSGFHRSL